MSIPFSEEELTIVGKHVQGHGKPDIVAYKYPVTEKEATKAFFDHKPIWAILETERIYFNPRIVPDLVARGLVNEAMPFDKDSMAGGPDDFGIEWVWEPEVGGSMERPGSEFMDDANDWHDLVKFPDVDSWDWETSAKENADFLDTDKYVQMWIPNGWFERLISFMGFEDAAVALVDDEQEDAIDELLMAISDMYIDIIDHVHKYYGGRVDGFYIHDDWGSQKDSFFHPDVVRTHIVPAMRKVTDHIHELGLGAEMHSCGMNEKQIENYIAAGWDVWSPQVMNDRVRLFKEYGDKIAICVPGTPYPEEATEEEQRAAARAWVDDFCRKPGWTAGFCKYDGGLLSDAYREELYVQSRKAYAAWGE